MLDPRHEDRPRFERLGWVSLWASALSLRGIPHGYLEGGAELLAWLAVDFDLEASEIAFCTNYTPSGEPTRIGALLADLHAAESFEADAGRAAQARGMGQASFVVGLYDLAYEPADLGIEAAGPSPDLIFVGAFPYAEVP